MVLKNKSGQLLIFSGMFLILLLVFSYSLETQNSYKAYSSNLGITNNIVHETCQVGKLSNGSNLDSRYSSFVSSVDSYCDIFSYNCSLTITKQGGAPTNLTLLNYTHYDYSLNYSSDKIEYSNSFRC